MQSSSGKRGWYWLLLIPFIGTLWPPFYASDAPELWGIPFFYWYQFVWVLISAALTAIVYKATKSPDDTGAGPGNGTGSKTNGGPTRNVGRNSSGSANGSSGGNGASGGKPGGSASGKKGPK